MGDIGVLVGMAVSLLSRHMKPAHVVAFCITLAVVLLGYAAYALWTGDPRHGIGLSGVILASFFFSLAHAAHKRARAEGGGERPRGMRVTTLYTLFDRPQPATELGEWWGGESPFSQVVGFSSLGSAFLRDPKERTYAVLWPFRAGPSASSVGRFESVAEFEARFLKDPAVAGTVLERGRVVELRRLYGSLEPGQCYIPVPYPILAPSPKTYDRGDFWVFMDLCGQTHAMLSHSSM